MVLYTSSISLRVATGTSFSMLSACTSMSLRSLFCSELTSAISWLYSVLSNSDTNTLSLMFSQSWYRSSMLVTSAPSFTLLATYSASLSITLAPWLYTMNCSSAFLMLYSTTLLLMSFHSCAAFVYWLGVISLVNGAAASFIWLCQLVYAL